MHSLQYLVDLIFSTVHYYDLFGSLAALRTHGLQFSNNIHSFDNFSEHNVFSIKPTGLGTGDEELTAIGAGPSIRHRKYTRLAMSELKVLIVESGTINGFTTSAIVVSEIATLAHEIRDHPVETATLVAKTLLSGAESTEVLCRLRDNILPQLHHDATHGLVVRGHVEVNAWQCHVLSCCGEAS